MTFPYRCDLLRLLVSVDMGMPLLIRGPMASATAAPVDSKGSLWLVLSGLTLEFRAQLGGTAEIHGDDTGCNGPDGEEWVDEGYRDRATPSAGAVQKITHTTRECLRMAGKGEYPENCAYKSYDPAVNHDYSGRTRVPAA